MKFDIDSILLKQSISDEIAKVDYIFNDEDYNLLQKMLLEINDLGYNFSYLAEIDAVKVSNIGNIIRKYIFDFSSQATRGYLVSQLVFDKVEDCDKLVLELYNDFRSSKSYISLPGEPAPAHIYTRYDNAFRLLKPKRLKAELIKLAYNPRDAFYLPFTMRMLASWKDIEVKVLLLSYLDGDTIKEEDIGITNANGVCFPSLSHIKRELKFTAIYGLKYYLTDEVVSIIKQYEHDDDIDIRMAAKKTMRKINQNQLGKTSNRRTVSD